MSKETIADLRTYVLVGDCDLHGNPWHSGEVKVTSGDSTNLYPGAVPIKRVRSLFDFPVEVIPHSYTLADGRTFLSNRVDVARGDNGKLLGIFTDGWVEHAYAETLLENVAKMVQESEGDLHIDSAGLLAGGGEGWVSIATSGLLCTPEGVEYFPHIFASTSLNGTLATTYKAVVTMTVCDNTRAQALSEKTPQFKIKHTKYSAAKLNQARDALGLLTLQADSFAAEVKLLCEQTVTDAQWSEFVKALAPITDDSKAAGITRAENARETLTSIYVGDPRAEQWHGTAFGALQAVNIFDLWERGTRGDTHAADRVVREAITGKLDSREAERANMLGLILANV